MVKSVASINQSLWLPSVVYICRSNVTKSAIGAVWSDLQCTCLLHRGEYLNKFSILILYLFQFGPKDLVLGLGSLTFAQDIAFLIYDPFRNSLAPWLAIIIFQGERANKRYALIFKGSLEKERDERQKWTGMKVVQTSLVLTIYWILSGTIGE